MSNNAPSDKPLLIVSDPSSKQAATTLAGHVYRVLTYAEATDTLIRGQRILLWPDAPGQGAAARAKKYAKLAKEVKAIVTSGQPKGWNAAQAVKDGWTMERLVEWAKPRALPISVTIHVNGNGDDTPKPTRSQYAAIEQLGLALSNGKPIGDMANIARFLERSEYVERIWYDEFYRKCFIAIPEEPLHAWSDVDTLKLTHHLQQDLGFRKLSKDIVADAVQFYGQSNTRNEPKDWLESLVWDQKQRISTFFSDFMGAEASPYSYAVGHNFWVSMVARVYRPGCQMDHMVVLEGPQNAGKTSALRLIGGKWYVEASESVQSKDFFMVLNGHILVEIAELDAFSRAEVNRIKQVVSCPVDAYRQPYARHSEEFPRTSIFVGTTNDDSYLKDATGGRRFWPMQCGRIDLPAIQAARDQLFAEAVDCFKAGDSWYETPDQETKDIQESRRQADEWESVLAKELQFLDRVTVTEAGAFLKVTVDKLDLRLQHRIGKCLRTIGFVKTRLRNEGVLERTWIRK